MKLLSLISRNPVPQPITAKPQSVLADPTEEYQQLAAKLGVLIVPQQSTSLQEILGEELIHIYPMENVRRYMKRITPSGKVWGWKPLRKIDRERCGRFITFSEHNNNGRFIEGIYERAVPYPALLTVEKIEEAIREMKLQPAFFVSDYTAMVPDPFLMVTIPASGESQYPHGDGSGRLWTANPEPACFVVERWDEPSFR